MTSKIRADIQVREESIIAELINSTSVVGNGLVKTNPTDPISVLAENSTITVTSSGVSVNQAFNYTFTGDIEFSAAGSLAINADGTIADGVRLSYSTAQNFSGDNFALVTKNYVDSHLQGLDPKQSARVASTANIDLSTGGLLTIDGITVADGDRVLVKNQTNPEENGIYVAGTGAWARSLDMDEWTEVPSAYLWVEEGTANANRGYVCTSNSGGVLETTAITWELFSTAGGYSASNGIALVGADFQLDIISLSSTAIALGDSILFADSSDTNNEKRTTVQALLDDLDIPYNIGTNGVLVRTTNDTYASRTITGTASRISITDGDGVAGNPTIDIDTNYVGQASITTLGTIATGVWEATVISPEFGGTGLGITTITENDIILGAAGNVFEQRTLTAGTGVTFDKATPGVITISASGLDAGTANPSAITQTARTMQMTVWNQTAAEWQTRTLVSEESPTITVATDTVTLANPPLQILGVYRNGQKAVYGVDYTVTGASEDVIDFINVNFVADEYVLVDYVY